MRILIVDDHLLVGQSLARVLADAGDETLGIARTGDEALGMLETTQTDLVLLDLSLPGIDGLDVLRQIRQRWPKVYVIVLTMWDDQYSRDAAKALGARGYLVKDIQTETLLAALAAAARGDAWFCPPSAERDGKTSRIDPRLSVTGRQYQVLCYVAHGQSYESTAAALDVSYHAVDGVIRRLHRRFGVHSNTDLIRKVMEHGLLEAGAPPPGAGSKTHS